MADVTSFLFQGSPVPPQPTASDVSTSYPLWLQQYTYNLANAATNITSTPYAAFPGQQVVTPSAQTQQAWNMANADATIGQAANAQAQSMTAAAGAPGAAQSQISSYMNPYQSYVTGALNTNLEQNILPGVQDKFTQAGQSRSPQEMQATNNAIYNNQQAIGSTLAAGYNNASNAALTGNAQTLSAGQQLGALGVQQQQQAIAGTGQVSAAGTAQDTLGQANINAAINNFDAQQQWQYNNLAFASNIIRGQAVPTTTQTVGAQYVNTPQAASPIQTFAGATAVGNGRGLKRGGHVRSGALNRLARAA